MSQTKGNPTVFISSSMDDLKEFTHAVDVPELTQTDQDYILELWHNGFDLKEPEKEFREI